MTGDELKALRLAHGLSSPALASMAEVHPDTVRYRAEYDNKKLREDFTQQCQFGLHVRAINTPARSAKRACMPCPARLNLRAGRQAIRSVPAMPPPREPLLLHAVGSAQTELFRWK